MELMDRMDGTRHKKWKVPKKEKPKDPVCSLGEELRMVEADWVTHTDAEENRRRRTLLMKRTDKASWGFTLQSYGIQNQFSDEVEMLTYVDYVEVGSPAYLAGLRPGDVILSINGVSMEDADHQDLVNFIKHSGTSMRMVVLFEDCCRKVELHGRCLKLKRVLAEKVFEMRSLEEQEKRLMSGLSRFDSCRSSRASSSSSLYSGHDDRFSLRPELDICPMSPSSNSSFENIKHLDNSGNLETLKQLDLSVSPRTPESPFKDRFSFDRSSIMSNLSAVTFAGVPSQWENGGLDHLAHVPLGARLKPQARQSTFGGIRNQRKLVVSQSYADRHSYATMEDLGKKPRPVSEGNIESGSGRRRHHSLEKMRQQKGELSQETSFINKSYGSNPNLHHSVNSEGGDLLRRTVEKNHHRRSLEESSGSEGRHRRHSGRKHDRKVFPESPDGASSDYENKHQDDPSISPIRPPRTRRSAKHNQSWSPVGNTLLPSGEQVDFQIGDDPHSLTPFPFHSPLHSSPLHSSPYSAHSTSSDDSSLQFQDPNNASLQFHNPAYHIGIPAIDIESASDIDDSLDISYKGYDSDSSSFCDSSSSILESPDVVPFSNNNTNNANNTSLPYNNFVVPRIQLEFINERDEISKL